MVSLCVGHVEGNRTANMNTIRTEWRASRVRPATFQAAESLRHSSSSVAIAFTCRPAAGWLVVSPSTHTQYRCPFFPFIHFPLKHLKKAFSVCIFNLTRASLMNDIGLVLIAPPPHLRFAGSLTVFTAVASPRILRGRALFSAASASHKQTVLRISHPLLFCFQHPTWL